MPLRGQLILCVALLGAPQVATSQSSPGLMWDTTTIRGYHGRTMPAARGSLAVPLDARRPDGASISISVLRLAGAPGSTGSPTVFLMGGPGIPGSAMVPIPPYFALFDGLRQLGDVIIIDQRGTGNSTPQLDCAVTDTLPRNFFASRQAVAGVITSRTVACAAEWRSNGIDPGAFTTRASAHDLELVRRALRAERLNLLAFSYGSRLALSYLAQFPTRVDRMVLQGVNGPGLVAKRPDVVATKLRAMTALIASDTAWPSGTDLTVAARDARARLARAPAMVTVVRRRTNDTVMVPVGRDGLDATVALNLDDVRIPALLTSVAAGDYRVLARFIDATWNGLDGGKAGLLGRAVNCAADRPAARWRMLRSQASVAPFGMPIDNEFLTTTFCASAGLEPSTPEFRGPVRSARPVLLITGTLDAINPVHNARDVARTLPNATLVSVEGAQHEALTIDVVQRAVLDFFSGKTVAPAALTTTPPRYPTVEGALAAPPVRR